MDKRAALAQLYQQEIAKCAENPLYFVFKYVYTKDEHDRRNSVKLFPSKPYLVHTLREWHTGPYIQYVAKSRQLMISWLMCAYAIWTAKFQPNALVLFQSKREGDAQAMVFTKDPSQARCSFMEANLPLFLRGCLAPDRQWLSLDMSVAGSQGTLVYPNGARIEAIPMGPTKVESRVPTLFLNDEASLQEEWASAQAAAKPCLTGTTEDQNGKGITVGTMRLPSDYGEETSCAADIEPDGIMKGMARFKSKSGVPSLRIHYSSDLDKDPDTPEGRAWLQRALEGYPGGQNGHLWQQHMEINPLARSGERCIPFWYDIQSKVVIPRAKVKPEFQLGWRYDAGFDWGARNNTVFLIFGNDLDGRRYLLHELSRPANEVGGIAGIAELMKKYDLFGQVNGRIQADPSMWNKDQNLLTGGLRSKAQLFKEHGVHLVPAKAKGQDADEVALERLNNYYWANPQSNDFDPRLFIVSDCKNTIQWFPLLRFEEWAESQQSEHDLKEKMHNLHMDEFDAFKYAEVARPTPGMLKAKPSRNSFSGIKQQIAKIEKQKKRANMGGKRF